LAQKLARKALHSAIIQLDAEGAPAGQYPVVIAKENGGVFFHEAIGHSLEADGIRKKTSTFWDKKGKAIASEKVSLADDGTVRGGRGTINVDDEGTPGQKTILIENGICTGFLFDKLNAKLMGTKSTGNGRRMSYKYFPIPRMTNTYLLPGEDDPADILKSVKEGIFIADIGGGNVNPTTGRFVFEVTEAYLIENGKKTRPLAGIQLIDNGLTVMKNITMVGPDLIVGGAGTCGKAGQGKPCGDGNPTFKVSSITIGGSKIRKG
jgi:TldD protein